jgi:diguanylate cyclase (GGDEF)-like protein
MVSLFNLSRSKKQALKVLVIEDSEDDTLLLLRQLQQNGYAVQHQRVDTVLELERSMQQPWDLILADYSMPALSGMEALAKVRSIDPDVPFIFVSGTIGEERAVEAIRKGAQDYVLKDKINRLPVVVRRELQDASARQEGRNAEQQLNYLARYDGLTGLPNRFTLSEFLKDRIEAYGPDQNIILFLHIHLERFRSLEHSLGQQERINFLQQVSNRLQQFTLEKGMVTRLSRDEFAVVHTGFTGKEPLENVVRGLVTTLAKPYLIGDMPVYCCPRIGAAVYPGGAFDADDLQRKAHIAVSSLLNDNDLPNNSADMRFYDVDMSAQLEARDALQRHLREALGQKELILLYQPQVDMSTGDLAALETMPVWHSPVHGIIDGEIFLPLAEESGFIFLLGEWLLRQVCQQIKLWEYADLSPLCIAVKIATRQLHEDNVMALLQQILREYDISPSCLRIEITDAAIMRNSGKARQLLHELKKSGIQVAMENLGDNYSNLAYLKNFVSDFVTISPSFTQSLGKNAGSEEVVANIINMAKKLELKTIAKGVSTAEQYRWLRQAGCDFAQGNYIAEPMDAGFIGGQLPPGRA